MNESSVCRIRRPWCQGEAGVRGDGAGTGQQEDNIVPALSLSPCGICRKLWLVMPLWGSVSSSKTTQEFGVT